MTGGLKEGEPNGRDVYADIIDHPHWQSPARPHMSLYDRAAQFSAFDALAGYSDMVEEEQRLTDTQVDPGEFGLEVLNQKLNRINNLIRDGEKPEVSITFFVKDPVKDGGSYETITEKVKKIDSIRRKVVLMRAEGQSGMNMEIDISSILEITGDPVD